MTWHTGAVATEAGQPSTARTGLLVICDDCRTRDEFISTAAVERAGSTEAVQRLLARRGWGWDHDGRDHCQTCLACTCGAIEHGVMAQHLEPCPLREERGDRS